MKQKNKLTNKKRNKQNKNNHFYYMSLLYGSVSQGLGTNLIG